jgi:hypothetical protein
MRSRTIVAALATPLMLAGTLAFSAGAASAGTWQDTSIQVNHLHATATNPAAPAVTADTAKGTITVTPAATGGVLSVNYHASRLLRGVTVTVKDGAITFGGTIGQPPAQRPIPAFAVVNDASPSGAVLAQIIRFTDDPVHGTLALGSVFADTPGAITRSYQPGGVQFAEPYVVTAKTVPGSPSALVPAPAYSFGYPGLPAGIVNSPAGALTVAGSTAAPGTYGPLGVVATDQYGARTASVYQLTVHAHPVYVPGNYGNEVNPFGNGFDVFRQRQAVNTMIVGWTATKADPATHFIREPGTLAGAIRFEYAPNGVGTGLYVSDPGFDAAGTGLKDGLVLRGGNNGPWQQWYQQANGTLKNAATGLIVSPNGTGAQLRGTVSASPWGGSAYTWTDYAHLPG